MATKLKTKTTNKVIAKSKLNAKIKETMNDPEVEALISNVVNISDAAKEAKALVSDYESQYKELKGYIPSDYPNDKDFTFKGEDGDVTFKACRNVTEVEDMEAIFNMLGKDDFLAIAKVSIADLKKYLNAKQLAEVTSVSKIGSRNLGSVVKA